MEQFYSSVRIKLPSLIYYKNKTDAIKTLLGTDIIIKSIKELDIIINNYVIVDVMYTNLQFDPDKLYYIKSSDIKPFTINSNKKIAMINNIPILLTIPAKFNDYKVLPMNIYKCLQNNQENTIYNYYGKINANPLHSYVSNISYPNMIINNITISEIPDEDIELFNEDQILNEYD